MNVNLLIDALVRQTTVLIAQLATAAGARALLAHTANQVFMDLVREFRHSCADAQGLGNKVIARCDVRTPTAAVVTRCDPAAPPTTRTGRSSELF